MKNNRKTRRRILGICMTGLMMAMTIVMSSFSIPVPGGHLYLCDVVICTAALLFEPGMAFIAGGVGSFIGDFLFYQPPMFVSLVTHGLQAAVISFISHHTFKKHPLIASILGVTAGSVIMVIGYTIGRAFIYSTPEYAMLKLPFEILQAVTGAVSSVLLCHGCSLRRRYEALTGTDGDS